MLRGAEERGGGPWDGGWSHVLPGAEERGGELWVGGWSSLSTDLRSVRKERLQQWAHTNWTPQSRKPQLFKTVFLFLFINFKNVMLTIIVSSSSSIVS